MDQPYYPPVLIHKPSGPTSFDIVASLRKITGIRKIGHTGTLDPLASGLLILLLGTERKKQDTYQGLPKEYLVTATLGATTTTYDSEGENVQTCEQGKLLSVTKEITEKAIKGFLGKQLQTVPAFSAIKVKGKRLYEEARKGKIDLKSLPQREITIHEIEMADFEHATATTPPTVSLRISCSKGTYIRSLIHDLGQKLGCGAYVSALVRTKIGVFSLENALSMEEFEKKWRSNDFNSKPLST
jgi:tRNA pseudouridine55 synthase